MRVEGACVEGVCGNETAQCFSFTMNMMVSFSVPRRHCRENGSQQSSLERVGDGTREEQKEVSGVLREF